ncbi:MAG: tRNA pseudouridine(55) synthase TruB [Candidatus Omnitrophota bacterium]
MRPETIPDPDGILLVDKPRTWTSHDVCAFLRSRFPLKKVGHAGTLDPLATGLLVILLGRATRLSSELSATDKEYSGAMRLGVETDSHDVTGKTVAEKPYEHLTIETIRKAAERFTGEILQTPPMVSAIKHQGTRLYKLARKGQEVEREARPITVHRFTVDRQEGPLVYFSVHVSKGTYVRTLVHDLAGSLGTAAALAELTRTRSGAFSLADAVAVEPLRTWSFEELKKKILTIYPGQTYARSYGS